MDQCFEVKGSIKQEDLLQVALPEDFNETSLIRMMQSMIVYETAFLDGASLLESTHQCIFLWDGSWSNLTQAGELGQALLSYSKSLIKSLGHVHQAVLVSDIYEGII